jgi:uncharacterized protein YjbI with pentapeptide repeats
MSGNNCDFTGNPPYDCTNCNLSNRDLSDKDLRNAILKNATLTGTIFKGVTSMAGADLRGATMGEGTDFSGVDLTTVVFDEKPKFGTNAKKPTLLCRTKINFNQLGTLWNCLDLTDAAITAIPTNITYFVAQKSNLTRLDFSGKIMKGAQFSGCNLTGIKLIGADISNATFPSVSSIQARTDLTLADLTDAKCPGAVFDRAILTSANFTRATLGGATFTSTGMQGTKFEHTDVTECTFSKSPSFGTEPDKLTSFKNTKLLLSTIEKEWSYLNLEGAQIVGLSNSVNLDYLQAKYAVLSGRNFSGYQLNNANLNGATINDCIFDDAHMTKARLKVVKGTRTSFKRATLNNAHFGYHDDDQTILLGADFTSAQLNGALFSKADLGPYQLAPVKQVTKFNRAVMTNMEFSMANLSNAELTGGISMHNTNFTSANFRDADLTGAQMGTFSRIFELKSTDNDYLKLYELLGKLNPYGMEDIFRKHNYSLSSKDTIVTMNIPGSSWTIADNSAAKQYNVLKWISTDGATSLIVSFPVKGATLSGAIMYNATLQEADLRNVNASEIQLYGDVNINGAKLHGINLTNSNLANIKLEKAILYNAILSRANLIKCDFTGAEMAGVSMEYANLQGAKFSGTNLDGVNLTNCAISVDIVQAGVAGVYLFGISPSKSAYASVLQELEMIAAKTGQPETLAKVKKDAMKGDITQCIAALEKGDMAAFDAATPGRKTILSPDAIISLIEPGKGWTITDPTKATGETIYTIWDGFDKSGYRSLFIQSTPVKVNKLFEEAASIKLRYQALISKSTVENCWDIDNDSFNNSNLQLGYMKFRIVKEMNGSLSFYGLHLRVQRMNAAGSLEIFNHTYTSTVFAKTGEKTQDCQVDGSGSVFGSDTICPNTLKFSTNQADNQPWMAVLRAPTLPKPPSCVPTLTSGCVSMVY